MSYALGDTLIRAGWMIERKIGNCEKSESKYSELRHKFLSTFSIQPNVNTSVLHPMGYASCRLSQIMKVRLGPLYKPQCRLLAQKVPVRRTSLELEPTYTLKVPEGTFQAWLPTSQ